MRKITAILLLGGFIASCDTSGVKEQEPSNDIVDENHNKRDTLVNILDVVHSVKDELKMDNGIAIRWFEHGSGETLKNGDFVSIDYKVLLTNGDVVDGNHLLNKEAIPFMLGFGMQTPGWDIALKELKVGDFAEVYIPSDLARGEHGIEGLIPPNADNVLKIRIIEKTPPTRTIDGNKVWVFEENKKNTKKFDEGKEIVFHCMVSTPTNAYYVNTYRQNNPFRMKLEDQGLVPGLKKALINAKKSDRMFIYVPSSEAYGAKGYLDVVKPNEDLFYNVLVMDVVDV